MSSEILIVDDNSDIRNIINDHNGNIDFIALKDGAEIKINFNK